MKSGALEHSFLGLIDFNQALMIQNNLWALAKDKNQVSVVGLHHPTVITLGKRLNQLQTDLHVNFNSVDPSVPIVSINRGGLATLHSEGQLVIYPIINLKLNNWGIKDFVSHLLKTTQKTFSDFEVVTFIDNQQVGLYTEAGKIAFCGLEIKQGVSQHGISINISNDLRLFDQIQSCGVKNLKTDNLFNYRFDVSLDFFFTQWIKNFKLTSY
jgi:lipoyl(octanoyl) transferase